MDISVVLPCYNTSGSLEILANRLVKVLENETKTFEIIMVNDCSPENDWTVIQELSKKDKRVKGLNLSRNFGQYEAITAGLDYSKGDNVVLMDADLQDLPEELPKLLRGIERGNDIVYGVRADRKDKFFKKLASSIFHKLFSYFSGTKTDRGIATYAVYSRKVVDVITSMRERYREIYILSNWVGFKVEKVEVVHAKREIGETSYDFKKGLDLALGAMFAYSDKPLKLSVILGFILSFSSLLYGLFNFIRALLGYETVPGWTSLIVSVWFLGGLILSFLGIIGIYIGKIFEEVKSRPLYIIKDEVNFK